MSERTYKKALILTGGAIKGCYQAGGVAEVLKHWEPDIIFGVSVGALNGAFILNGNGKDGNRPLGEIGEELANFWTSRITHPKMVARQRSILGLTMNLIRRRWRGVLDTTPYLKLVKSVLDTDTMLKSRIDFACGYVNMHSSFYYESVKKGDHIDPKLLDYIIASGSVPIMYPPEEINDHFLVDGGVRHVAPLNDPNPEYQFEEIVMVSCHPKNLDAQPREFDSGKLLDTINRLYDITVNQNVTSDLRIRRLINRLMDMGLDSDTTGWFDESDPDYVPLRRIKMKVVKPAKPLDIELSKFTQQDIERLVNRGRLDAKRVMDADWE